MEFLSALRKAPHGIVAIVFSVFMFFFLPFVQALGNNVDLWYKIILTENYGLNFIIFLIFCSLFGMFVSFQVYKFRQPKVCKIRNTTGGIAGSVFAFFVGVCPACLGFAGLFFPVGVVSTLVVFGPFFMLISIGLIVLSIYLNGGFKK